jgi:hypothetical protein
MTDVSVTPRISCDNCGLTEDKVFDSGYSKEWKRPKQWGGCKIEGYSTDSYGSKVRLDFTDLCQSCTKALIDAADEALKACRGEEAP